MSDISRFLPLANRIAWLRFAQRGNPAVSIDRRDLVQSAMLRVCATLADRTPEEQDRMAERTMVWAMQDELRWQDPLTRDQRQAHRAGDEQLPHVVFDAEPEWLNDEPDESTEPSAHLQHRQEVDALYRQIPRLSGLQRQTIEWFLSEQPQGDLAEKLGTTDSNISKAKAAALRNLRTRLTALGVHR